MTWGCEDIMVRGGREKYLKGQVWESDMGIGGKEEGREWVSGMGVLT